MASDDGDAKEGSWRPKGAMHQYAGLPVWDHDPGPHEHNDGEFDGDISFDDDDVDADEVEDDD